MYSINRPVSSPLTMPKHFSQQAAVLDRVQNRPRARKEAVREQVRQMIFDHRLAAGSRIVQQDLATQLGASVSVLREILVELASVGLVQMEESRGFFVRRMDLAKITETYLVRAVHEGLAARLCCERASREDVRELKRLAEEVYRLGRSPDEADLREACLLDRQIHTRLVEIARCEALSRAWRSCLIPIITGPSSSEGCAERSHGEHMALLGAIEDNRPEDAERLAREHIQRTLEYIQQRSASGKDDLRWYV
jgi:DNA-binding GntR family transcriptional regulator